MSSRKKEVRRNFRNTVFNRDDYTCVTCNHKPNDISELDAHHITNRNEMPAGGYVKENGVTLCPACHIKAEHNLNNVDNFIEGYLIEELYEKINSSYEKALEASKLLERNSNG